MIIPVYKQVGQTTHQLAQHVGELYGEKATHTGTLDPAAAGVVVVLTGEDRFKKEQLSDSKKIYSVEIVLGVGTDTDDELGLITELRSVSNEEKNTFIPALKNVTGTQNQVIHPFSSKRVDGHSYFDLAKAGTTPPEFTQEITIYSVAVEKTTTISKETLKQQQTTLLHSIQGEFRQQKIAQNWNENLSELSTTTTFTKISCTISCSKRTYIRSIIRDLRLKTKIPATVHKLIRTTNEPYSIKDCQAFEV